MSAKGVTAVAVLIGLAAVGLQVEAIRWQSLTSDEPYHLAAGHQALRWGVNTLNLEHPPLVKLVAAAPLLGEEEPLAPPVSVERWREAPQAVFADPLRARRLQLRARGLLLLAFGLPWLACCWALGARVGPRAAGPLLAAAMGLSFAVLPHLALATTDTAAALGFAATLLAAWRYLRSPDAAGAALLGGGFGLALAAKHSGVLALVPVAAALLLARPGGETERGREGESGGSAAGGAQTRPSGSDRCAPSSLDPPPLGRRLVHAALALGVAAAALYATYLAANHRYDPQAGRETIRLYCERRSTLIVEERLRPYEPHLLALERVSPPAAQWLTGMLGVAAQNAIGVYPSYVLGEVSRYGRWWYFPFLLLVKTPLPLLLASAGALVAALRSSRRPRPAAAERDAGRRFRTVLALTAAAYLAVAMSSNYNLGYRHLLPVLPILVLPAAAWAARRPWRAGALAVLLSAEAVALRPLWLSATNTWWLGEANPTRFALAADDFDWKQNLAVLGRETRRRGAVPLRVVDPLVHPAELAAYVPEGRVVQPGEPLAPGWYAVALRVEQMFPALVRAHPDEVYNYERFQDLARRWIPLWHTLRTGEPHGVVAASYRLYRLDPSDAGAPPALPP